jgi:hypothetical protein
MAVLSGKMKKIKYLGLQSAPRAENTGKKSKSKNRTEKMSKSKNRSFIDSLHNLASNLKLTCDNRLKQLGACCRYRCWYLHGHHGPSG